MALIELLAKAVDGEKQRNKPGLLLLVLKLFMLLFVLRLLVFILPKKLLAGTVVVAVAAAENDDDDDFSAIGLFIFPVLVLALELVVEVLVVVAFDVVVILPSTSKIGLLTITLAPLSELNDPCINASRFFRTSWFIFVDELVVVVVATNDDDDDDDDDILADLVVVAASLRNCSKVLSDGDNDVKYPRHISPVEYLEWFLRISITIKTWHKTLT